LYINLRLAALASSNWEKTNHKSNGEEIEIWLKETKKEKKNWIFYSIASIWICLCWGLS